MELVILTLTGCDQALLRGQQPEKPPPLPEDRYSFPTQDEPERADMLRMDDQRPRSREVNSATEREIPFRHRGGTIRGQ
jgi:hypothetical protein